MAKLKVPVEDVVPLNTPVPEFRLNPLGREPDTTVQPE
jgi:hypothetical protein